MPWNSEHTNWFFKIETNLKSKDGKEVCLLEYNYDLNDKTVLSKWAKHFRNHYCFDSEIDFLRNGTGLSRKDFLVQLKFPTEARGFGSGIRSGDFSEILVADYLEYILGYWVPRTRYGNKTIRDESTKGTDLIGFKLYDENKTTKDVLKMFEVKAQYSGNKAKPRLQDAIDDSIKDDLRKAESLNAIKQRLFDKGKTEEALKVARFQNQVDMPYTSEFGVAALYSNDIYDEDVIINCDTSAHPYNSALFLIVIKGDDMMKLVHKLFEIAADES
ncbi:MAG: Hachiman antiphage defense system protein HamA [Mesonia sp.]|uniref:Hachiman antiphage defense system protein HamA n=1 Tax=Mesonia sp. TaxID=1960830 RepID=UPI0032421DA7